MEDKSSFTQINNWKPSGSDGFILLDSEHKLGSLLSPLQYKSLFLGGAGGFSKSVVLF